jgi:lycopene beta-cyclase
MRGSTQRYDIILAGGGLANGLLAWRLRQLHPALRVLLIEAGPTLGGNHTWSFHQTLPDQAAWLSPLLARAWPSYRVRFPAYERSLDHGYASILSADFHAILSADLGDAVLLGQRVDSLTPMSVTLSDGTALEAETVIDGRGTIDLHPHAMGFQKFLGMEFDTEEAHGVITPMLMDARVPQTDGFRFYYVLPLSERRLLVEDTSYSESPALDLPGLRRAVAAYCSARNWRLYRIEREEQGVLPIPYRVPEPTGGDQGVPAIGLSGGLFHPVTGYSVPLVVQTVDGIAALPHLSSASVGAWLQDFRKRNRRQFAFLAFLNRMLFQAAEPHLRYRVLQHFYRMPPALIDRFYAARLTTLDYPRILSGRPPVPVHRALACIRPSKPHLEPQGLAYEPYRE